MNSYINIQIKPDVEFRESVLLNKTFSKLHKALFDANQITIGVSFPNYKIKLGEIIRLHSDKAALETLQQTNWLGGLAGYCEISDILTVPEKVDGYRTISRIQQNMTKAKLNRLMKRGSISEEEKKKYQAKMFATGLDNPYLELLSKSTGEKYRMYIAFSGLQTSPVAGSFNHFGLNKAATVPWF